MATSSSPLALLQMLTRPQLSAGVAVVAAVVYVYYRNIVDAGTYCVATGVFLLSCAASILNQYQERATDARMERTRQRPFAAGIRKTGHLLALAAGIGVTGLTLLFAGTGAAAAALGLFTVIVYNGVYTPAKRRTPFALFAGAVAGSLPVLIGGAAATGRIDAKAGFIAGFLFVWQIPHFLLLSIRFSDDYRNAGIPALPALLPASRLRVITVLWMLAACGMAMLFPVAGIVISIPLAAGLMLSTIIMLMLIVVQFVRSGDSVRGWMLHVYQGVIMAILALQGLTGR